MSGTNSVNQKYQSAKTVFGAPERPSMRRRMTHILSRLAPLEGPRLAVRRTPCGGTQIALFGRVGRIYGVSNGAHEQYNLKFEISNLKLFLV